MSDIRARFDDLRDRRSFELQGCVAEHVAERSADVRSAIEAAEAAAASGLWVAGFVTYEAAPGLDPVLAVHSGHPGSPPMVWFGAFEERVDVAPPAVAAPAGERWDLEWDARRHAHAVSRIKALIASGDTYQVNLTARAHANVADVPALYSSLLHAQRTPYGALIETPSHSVACASPELFFETHGDRILAAPMKGTARRGRTPAEDAVVAGTLRSSSKDVAENVMIVDLVRSDLGRVAETGTVRVADLVAVERYPTVWQLTSRVAATLRPGTGLAEVFAALFPSGSVTGAPKRRTMEIIAVLETSPRGVYCGAVGVMHPGARRTRFAVGIRTATVDRSSGQAQYGAGGGITWPSDAAAEWRELNAKMAVLAHPSTPAGVFETMRREKGTLRNADRHVARLLASADYFDLPAERPAVERALDAVRGGGSARIRLELRASGVVTAVESPLPPADEGPVRLAVAAERIDASDPWWFHKTIERDRYDRRRAGRADADDVILVNSDGLPTETTIANLCALLDGRWWTPTAGAGLLPGVERARLLEAGVIAERRLTLDELRSAEALAVISSLRGWRPAVLIP